MAQTSSDREVFAAARFSARRSLSDFCAGFLPACFGFCVPFIVCLLSAARAASHVQGRNVPDLDERTLHAPSVAQNADGGDPRAGLRQPW